MSPLHRLLAAAALGLLASCGPGTRGPGPVLNKPAFALELHDTRWWIPSSDGRLDRRNIDCRRVGDAYQCTLVNPGKVLPALGFTANTPYCQLRRVGPARYEGTFMTRLPTGESRWVGVAFTAENENILRWTENGNDQWERLP